MRDLKAIIIATLLLLQISCVIVANAADSMADVQAEGQNDLSFHKDIVANLLEMLRNNVNTIGQDSSNLVAEKMIMDPNIAYGWHGKMKIVKFLASITLDVDLNSNIGG